MWDVMQPMLKLDMLCHHSVKIIFFGYSKPLPVEIMENGWRPAECQRITPDPIFADAEAPAVPPSNEFGASEWLGGRAEEYAWMVCFEMG